jgi:outer membrane protein OmpA-like peptidoglycan-associated protein
MCPFALKKPLITLLVAAICVQSTFVNAQDYNAGQASGSDPCASNTGQAVGAVAGALLGAWLGNKVGKGNGRKLATVAGAVGGLALGNYIGSEMDRRKCEVSKIAKQNNLNLVITDIRTGDANGQPAAGEERAGLSIAIQDRPDNGSLSDAAGGDALGNAASSSQFQSGSDVLNSNAAQYFHDIAMTYVKAFNGAAQANATQEDAEAARRLRDKRIFVLGHTDDTGSSRLNADLSEKRARAVARIFSDAGVPMNQIYFQGSGETQPIADNRTPEGRALNRRVEIVDLADEQAFQRYLTNRAANVDFYRIATAPAEETHPRADELRPAEPAPRAPRAIKPAAKVAAQPDAAPASRTLGKPAAPAMAATPATPAPTPATVHPRAVAPAIDFGGSASLAQAARIDIGKPVAAKASWSPISSAHADDLPMARACTEDHPRIANPVRELAGNRAYQTSEYVPGLYSTSWVDQVNGNLVALTKVAVLRDGAAPVGKPTVLVYKAGPDGKPNTQGKPTFKTEAYVNAYQGQNGLLYRVFVDGPIKCLDIVMRPGQPVSGDSNLYYQAGSTTMVKTFQPKLARN